jgi:hypothetical protein
MAGHSRPKDGVALLAYSRPKDGVALLAYSRPEDGVALLAYSRPKDGVALLAYVPAIHVFLPLRKTWITGTRAFSAAR